MRIMYFVVFVFMKRGLVIGHLVLVAIVCCVSPAAAQCGCTSEATCRGYLGSDFVFTAKVTAVTLPEPVVDPDAAALDAYDGRATLSVGNVFRGIVPATIDVTIGGACDYPFQVGHEYLVYGQSNQDADGQVVIGVDGCSRTRLLAEADADVALIKSMNANKPEASLFGEVIPVDVVRAIFDDAPAYVVTLRGNGRRYEMRTTGGPYEFNLLPPGSYELTISRGNDFDLRHRTQLDAQACVDAGSIRVP